MPHAPQTLTVQRERDLPLRQPAAKCAHVAVTGGVRAAVPDDDVPRPVLSGGYGSLELVVRDGVILDLSRESLHRGIAAWALGDGPALHRSIELQTKIVMEMRGAMLLD